jgi:hypothetical protein
MVETPKLFCVNIHDLLQQNAQPQEEQLSSLYAAVVILHSFNKHEGSMPYSQKCASKSYPEMCDSSLHLFAIFFLCKFNQNMGCTSLLTV